MKTTMLAVLVGMVLSGAAFAQSVDQRADNLQHRINQGVKSGELTLPEAARLQRRENHLRREIARDKADGRGLTVRERAKIQRQENRLSRSVYVQKHDRQSRP